MGNVLESAADRKAREEQQQKEKDTMKAYEARREEERKKEWEIATQIQLDVHHLLITNDTAWNMIRALSLYLYNEAPARSIFGLDYVRKACNEVLKSGSFTMLATLGKKRYDEMMKAIDFIFAATTSWGFPRPDIIDDYSWKMEAARKFCADPSNRLNGQYYQQWFYSDFMPMFTEELHELAKSSGAELQLGIGGHSNHQTSVEYRFKAPNTAPPQP